MKALRLIKNLIYTTCFFSGLLASATLYYKGKALLSPQVIYMDRAVEVPAQPRPLSEIISEAASKAKIPAVLISAIIEQESGGDPTAVKFEAHYLSRVPARITHPDQRRLWASSIGLMQPMAIHLLKLAPHLDYTALFDPEVNIAIGVRVLSDCLKRHQAQPPSRRWRLALTCYNGSEVYAEEVLERVGVIALDS